MDKNFKTIKEQIAILQERGLIIDNENPEKIFKDNNYYYLINGYKDLFVIKDNNTEKYKENVKLSEIYALYEFDRELRFNFLKYILTIERKMDTYIAYEFSKQYGHKDYLLEINFNNTISNSMKIKELISEINNDMVRQIKIGNRMLGYYINKYGYIPLWVLIRILTFGEISKFYGLMKQKEQNAIAKNFNVIEKRLKSYLERLSIIRNICAHDEKLYDVRLRKNIAETKYHRLLKCNNKGYRDLFSIITILKMLLEEEDFKKFYNEIIDELDKLKNNIKSVEFIEILNKMGFPQNYKELM